MHYFPEFSLSIPPLYIAILKYFLIYVIVGIQCEQFVFAVTGLS